MIVLDIISQLFFFFFFDGCKVASLRTNFLGINLPHTLSNALSLEELNRLGFNDVSGGVCFVYYFVILQRI